MIGSGNKRKGCKFRYSKDTVQSCSLIDTEKQKNQLNFYKKLIFFIVFMVFYSQISFQQAQNPQFDSNYIKSYSFFCFHCRIFGIEFTTLLKVKSNSKLGFRPKVRQGKECPILMVKFVMKN